MEKMKQTVTVEVQNDDKGFVKGVEVKVNDLTLFEAIGVLEIAKNRMIESQTKKDTWNFFKK